MKCMRCCLERRATQLRQMMPMVTKPESRPLFCSSLSGTASVWRESGYYTALSRRLYGENGDIHLNPQELKKK